MNWFTKSFVGSKTKEQKEKLRSLDECWGGECEHVSADIDKLYVISRENDSFGHESYGCCEACYDKQQEYEDSEEVVCYDCKGTFQKKDTISWKWYDFYAAQGDEPLTICNECRIKPTHVSRVKRDREDYEEEMAYYDRGDGNGY